MGWLSGVLRGVHTSNELREDARVLHVQHHHTHTSMRIVEPIGMVSRITDKRSTASWIPFRHMPYILNAKGGERHDSQFGPAVEGVLARHPCPHVKQHVVLTP